jgi:four helix bundle protein
MEIQTRTFNFSVRIVRLHQHLIKSGETSKILSNQILRSGTSIGANLEEAQAGQSKADFLSKCSISLKEARETHYWLRLLDACELIPTEKIAPITQEANEIIAILTTIAEGVTVYSMT